FSEGGHSYDAHVVRSSATSFHYDMVLPAGTYTLTSSLMYSFQTNSQDLTVTQAGVEPVEVCGDRTVDVALPDVGPLQNAVVHVAGLENIPRAASDYFFFAAKFGYATSAGTAVVASGMSSSLGVISLGAKVDVNVMVPVKELSASLFLGYFRDAFKAASGAYL